MCCRSNASRVDLSCRKPQRWADQDLRRPGLLHLLGYTYKLPFCTDNPARLKPDMREIDELRRHLRRRHIHGGFRGDWVLPA